MYEVYTRVETVIFPFGSSALWLDYDLLSGLVMRNGERMENDERETKNDLVRSLGKGADFVCPFVCVLLCICVYVYVYLCWLSS